MDYDFKPIAHLHTVNKLFLLWTFAGQLKLLFYGAQLATAAKMLSFVPVV
jgi:hypothetical protein